jgi:hypothetical protein
VTLGTHIPPLHVGCECNGLGAVTRTPCFIPLDSFTRRCLLGNDVTRAGDKAWQRIVGVACASLSRIERLRKRNVRNYFCGVKARRRRGGRCSLRRRVRRGGRRRICYGGRCSRPLRRQRAQRVTQRVTQRPTWFCLGLWDFPNLPNSEASKVFLYGEAETEKKELMESLFIGNL